MNGTYEEGTTVKGIRILKLAKRYSIRDDCIYQAHFACGCDGEITHKAIRGRNNDRGYCFACANRKGVNKEKTTTVLGKRVKMGEVPSLTPQQWPAPPREMFRRGVGYE